VVRFPAGVHQGRAKDGRDFGESSLTLAETHASQCAKRTGFSLLSVNPATRLSYLWSRVKCEYRNYQLWSDTSRRNVVSPEPQGEAQRDEGLKRAVVSRSERSNAYTRRLMIARRPFKTLRPKKLPANPARQRGGTRSDRAPRRPAISPANNRGPTLQSAGSLVRVAELMETLARI
jgi:hypothetical protein